MVTRAGEAEAEGHILKYQTQRLLLKGTWSPLTLGQVALQTLLEEIPTCVRVLVTAVLFQVVLSLWVPRGDPQEEPAQALGGRHRVASRAPEGLDIPAAPGEIQVARAELARAAELGPAVMERTVEIPPVTKDRVVEQIAVAVMAEMQMPTAVV